MVTGLTPSLAGWGYQTAVLSQRLVFRNLFLEKKGCILVVKHPPAGDGVQQDGADYRKLTLTHRQREIYEFLRDQIVNQGISPTVREIGDKFAIRSPNGVICHLRALERKGLISRGQNMSRAILLADRNPDSFSVPFIGAVTASGPMQPAVSTDQSIRLQGLLLGRSIGCLLIDCDRFEAIHIARGDYLLINAALPLKNGSHVAALDHQHCLTICVVTEGAHQLVPLMADNNKPARTSQVLGVITAVVRSLTQHN